MDDSGDLEQALDRYRWSHAMAAELWTLIGHFEVLLRHRIDTLMIEHCREKERGIPWFMLPDLLNESGTQDVAKVITRLQKHNKVSRDQIIAGQDFGFWKSLFGSDYDELWKRCLYRLIDEGSSEYGLRKDVMIDLEEIRKLRNRVAHHDSLANVPLADSVHRILKLASAINPEAEAWISANSRWRDVASERPDLDKDAVVVAARVAWDIYQHTSEVDRLGAAFYVCQPGRFFRDVKYLGFYEDRKIHQDFPKILAVRDNVTWTREHAEALQKSEDRTDKKIGRLIDWSFNEGASYPWTTRRVEEFAGTENDDPADPAPRGRAQFKVFALTKPTHPHHRRLAAPLENTRTGRGSAFTQRQRYVSLDKLQLAQSIDDVIDSDIAE